MAIDPKILARMQSVEDGVPSAEYIDAMTPLSGAPLQGEPTTGMPLPALRGSEKQVKWATTIRANALALDWPSANYALLRSVVDSTWWIANKAIVNTMKFKPPSSQQTNGSVAIDNTTAPLDVDVVERQNRLARDVEARVSDAERWAASVSKNPERAKAAILAVLSRLYEGTMKTRLRNASRAALEASGEADAKDMDAINRMLSS